MTHKSKILNNVIILKYINLFILVHLLKLIRLLFVMQTVWTFAYQTEVEKDDRYEGIDCDCRSDKINPQSINNFSLIQLESTKRLDSDLDREIKSSRKQEITESKSRGEERENTRK